MKFRYYPETDSLYIEFSENPSSDSEEIAPNVVLDFDGDRNLVGIDIDHASKIINLARLEMESLPLHSIVLNNPQPNAVPTS